MQVTWIQYSVWELRCHMLRGKQAHALQLEQWRPGAAKKKKKERKKNPPNSWEKSSHQNKHTTDRVLLKKMVTFWIKIQD